MKEIIIVVLVLLFAVFIPTFLKIFEHANRKVIMSIEPCWDFNYRMDNFIKCRTK